MVTEISQAELGEFLLSGLAGEEVAMRKVTHPNK
jgi:hypothetical protein